MAVVYGKEYTKQELLRYVGNISALAGVQTVRVETGMGDTVKLHEVTAGDIAFTLAESKNLDMTELKYKGMPVQFISSVGGVTNRALGEPHGWNFLWDNGVGMLYTAGSSNVGMMFGEDETEPFHGRVRFLPATNIKVISDWEGDDYVVGVQGETREAGLFKQNTVATRRVTTKLGSKSIDIHTVVENQSFLEQPFMNLLHINVGFPIVDEGALYYIPAKDATPINDEAVADLDNHYYMPDPTEGHVESNTLHNLFADADGMVYAAVYNPMKKLGFAVSFKKEHYHMLDTWKCMGPGCYLMGMLPMNCSLDGQEANRAAGTLKTLKPFEKGNLDITLTIIDGDEDFKVFKAKFDGCRY